MKYLRILKSLKSWMLLIILLLLLSIVVNIRFIIGSRATSTGSTSAISQLNSYVFVSPLKAQANGQDRIRVNVVLLNETGKGVPNQSLVVTSEPTLQYEAIQQNTDAYGRAIFDLYTSEIGQYTISVTTTTGTKIGEPLTVQFE